MKNFQLLSVLLVLSCTKAFTAEDTRQAELDKERGHVFKTYTIEAESQHDICCGSYEEQMDKARKRYKTSVPEATKAKNKEWIERCRREGRKVCCGKPGTDTSHAIAIEKFPRSSEGRSVTVVTPLNPNGATYNANTDSHRLMWSDKALNDGASIVQNPSNDTGIRFIGGSYDSNKKRLIAQIAINELCERKQLDVKANNEYGVRFFCPEAVYSLYDLAQKSIAELVKDNPSQSSQ